MAGLRTQHRLRTRLVDVERAVHRRVQDDRPLAGTDVHPTGRFLYVGFENFAQIVSTPDIAMVYVGPHDFSISVGHPGEYDHPEVRRRMEEMLDVCRRHDVPFGTTPSGAESAGVLAARGASFFEVRDEMSFIQRGATQLVETWRMAIGG